MFRLKFQGSAEASSARPLVDVNGTTVTQTGTASGPTTSQRLMCVRRAPADGGRADARAVAGTHIVRPLIRSLELEPGGSPIAT